MPQNLKLINNILKIQGDCFHWASSKRCKYDESRLGALQVSKIEKFCEKLISDQLQEISEKNPQQYFSKREFIKIWDLKQI